MVVNLSIHLFKHNYCFNQHSNRIQNRECQDTGFTPQILLRDTDRYITNFKVPLPKNVVTWIGPKQPGFAWPGLGQPKNCPMIFRPNIKSMDGSKRPQCASPSPFQNPALSKLCLAMTFNNSIVTDNYLFLYQPFIFVKPVKVTKKEPSKSKWDGTSDQPLGLLIKWA